MNDSKINILIKAWETYQNLSKGFGENAWKIRATGIGFWAAVIGYAYQNKEKEVYLFSLLIVIMFFILESGVRILQNKYISKSNAIEDTINDYLIDEPDLIFPSEGISTNFSVPEFKDFINLFRWRRWMFWLPYLALVIISLIFRYKY